MTDQTTFLLPEPTARIKRHHLDMRAKLQIKEILSKVCTQIDFDGEKFALYQPGWTDRRVAETADAAIVQKVTEGHVRAVRLMFFGETRRRAPEPVQPLAPAGRLLERLQAAEATNSALERRVAALEAEIAALAPLKSLL